LDGRTGHFLPPRSKEVLEIVVRIAGVASDLTQINKRLVHRQAEIMGVRAAIRAGGEFQALAGHQDSVQAFKADPLATMKRQNAADADRRKKRTGVRPTSRAEP
jgi:hypothetical protein